MSKFKVGDIVEWTSQAGGYTRTKVGEVVAVIPEDTDPRNIVMPGRLNCPGYGRPEESYVVRVGPRSRRLYWPRVSHLRLAGMTPERAAFLAGIRVGLEAAAKSVEEGCPRTKAWSKRTLWLDRAAQSVRSLSAEAIAKEAADAAARALEDKP